MIEFLVLTVFGALGAWLGWWLAGFYKEGGFDE